METQSATDLVHIAVREEVSASSHVMTGGRGDFNPFPGVFCAKVVDVGVELTSLSFRIELRPSSGQDAGPQLRQVYPTTGPRHPGAPSELRTTLISSRGSHSRTRPPFYDSIARLTTSQ